MKKTLLILLPILLFSSCSGESKENLTVYLDNSEASTSSYRVKVNRTSAYKYGSDENYSFYLNLSVKNLTTQTQTIKFTNMRLVRESNGATYTVGCDTYRGTITLDSEIEDSVSFSSTIPTSLEEKYYFSVDFKNINYKVFLYNSDSQELDPPEETDPPEEIEEYVTITYMVNDEIVRTDKIKKGTSLTSIIIYDTPDHQYYASKWKDTNGNQLTTGMKIESDLVVTAQLTSNFQLSTTGSDTYTFVNKVNHVPADGKVVLLDKYINKEICLGMGAIYNSVYIKEVYLPTTLHVIYANNFSSCGNLKTIYYAGTQEQWDAINKEYVTIPSNIKIVYNTSFNY